MGLGKIAVQTGLDIGTSSIKLAQLSGVHSNLSLVKFDIIKLEDSPDSQSAALANIAKTLSNKEVNISISGPSLVVRYIELPKMKEEELASSMKFEASKYIPFDIKDTILDCKIIENIGQGKIRVLLAAAKKDAISSRLKLIQDAGLSANIIDCDAFAMSNAFLFNYPDVKEGSSTALLNLGEKSALINILRNKAPQFTRSLELDAHDSAHLLEEVKLSLHYYENQAGMAVDNIYLSGAFSSLEGLAKVLHEGLGIECGSWDPVKRIKIGKDISPEKLESLKHQLPIAVGLAMRQ